jgi:hypothetical protein
MRTTMKAAALATLLATLLPAAAWAGAGDFCIHPSIGGATFVGKKFKPPRPGQCRAWNGFLLLSVTPVAVSTGTACTASDGSALRLQLTSARAASAFVDYIVLPLPAATGGTLDEFLVGQSGTSPSFHLGGMEQVACDPKRVPVP